MPEEPPAHPPRLLVIIPRSRAVERVPLMRGFREHVELIIDRRVVDRRHRPSQWPPSECRRRGERRCQSVESGGRAVIHAS